MLRAAAENLLTAQWRNDGSMWALVNVLQDDTITPTLFRSNDHGRQWQRMGTTVDQVPENWFEATRELSKTRDEHAHLDARCHEESTTMRWLPPLRALWAVICLLAGQPSMATEWTLGDSSVQTTNGAANMPDMLAIAGPWGTVTFPFNRNRTPVDVLDGSQDGSIRLPGRVLSADAHRVLRRPTRSRLPLDALTDITTPGRRVAIHRGTRHCVIHLPAGWKIEDMRAERLPRDVAASARAALLLARGSTSDSLRPTRVDLGSCKVKTGQRIRQIGFDALLQGHAGGWWLTSTAENMLLISKDGMHWTDLPLPQATHALLGAHVTPDGQTWIAVSQADIGFRLQAYRWEGMAHGWAQAAMSEVPHTWVDFARLAAEDRLSPQSHEAPQR